MKAKPVEIVHVYYKPKNTKIPVGRLALKSSKIFFEYNPQFLQRDLHLSPFKLPLKPGIFSSKDFTFDGLFGVFNDSLPDGWGRLLIDRHLIQHHINPLTLSPLDRLCCVGQHGMGALIYEPEHINFPLVSHVDLDKIAAEIHTIQHNEDALFVEDLLSLGGSSAGARPKVLLDVNTNHTMSQKGEGKDTWMIKFRSGTDRSDIGCIEYAYHLMANAAGLDVPKAQLFPSKKGHGFFGVKRFDRTSGHAVHMHTISGLLHADHRIPSLDYETILKATMYLTRDIRECEKLFRLCTFNVLSHNRDDHAKNFSFLMDNSGTWQTSPAYDLTFSSGPNGEHCSMIMGEGKYPGHTHLLKLASTCMIQKQRAEEIIEEVKHAIIQWPHFAQQATVTRTSSQMIERSLKKIIKDCF